MCIFKGIALLSLIFVAQKCKISVTHNRESEVARSEISHQYAKYWSFLILLLIWIGTEYLGKWMTLSHIICYVFSTQQAAHWCSQLIPCSPIPGKKTPLGQLVILDIKTLPFQTLFSPKSFGLGICYGRYSERWATAGHKLVHRSSFIIISLKAFWILLLHVTNLWQDVVWNGEDKNDQFSHRSAWAGPTSALNDPVHICCVQCFLISSLSRKVCGEASKCICMHQCFSVWFNHK